MKASSFRRLCVPLLLTIGQPAPFCQQSRFLVAGARRRVPNWSSDLHGVRLARPFQVRLIRVRFAICCGSTPFGAPFAKTPSFSMEAKRRIHAYEPIAVKRMAGRVGWDMVLHFCQLSRRIPRLSEVWEIKWVLPAARQSHVALAALAWDGKV